MDLLVPSRQNLERLRSRSRELAMRVESARAEDVQVVEGRSDTVGLCERGVRLGSAYDPEREAESMAEAATPEGVDLVVLVGLGLGLQVERIRERTRAPILIYEPSAARLRALCAVRPDLRALAVDESHWASDPEDLARLFKRFYLPGLRVQIQVHPAVQQLDPDATRGTLRALARAKDAVDLTASTRVVMSEAWARLTVENTPELLATPSFMRLAGAFPGSRAVVVAAGPSLDKQLPRLAEVADRCIVIAIGQAVAPLRAAGIEPDLVHVIESQNVSHQLEVAGAVEQENLVVSPSTHPSLFRLETCTRFVATPVTNPLAHWIEQSRGIDRWCGGGATVAQGAVRLAAELGATRIALIGQDLAFTGGRIYAKGSAYDALGLRQDDDGNFVYTHVREKAALFPDDTRDHQDERAVDQVMVEGWDGRPIASSKSYAAFIEHYRGIADELRSTGVQLVNCTEGGAHIPGLDHQRFTEFTDRLGGKLFARETIRRRHQKPLHVDPEPLRSSAERARRALDEMRAESGRGLRHTSRARRRFARSGDSEVALLKSISRCEKRVRTGLGQVPWFDALVASGLHIGAAHSVRAARQPECQELATALEEANRLFETVRVGVDAGIELLDHLEERLTGIATAIVGGPEAVA